MSKQPGIAGAVKEVMGEEMFLELMESNKPAKPAELAKALGVRTYSPDDLVQCFIDNPTLSLGEIAKLYGKTTGWVWACIASEGFQLALDPRRSEIHNPSITLTFKERFQTVALHALEVLNKKLESPKVDDATVLGAIGVSVKALGINGKDNEKQAAPLQQRSISDLASSMEGTAERAIEQGEALGMIPQSQQTVMFNPDDYTDSSAD